MKHPMTTIIKEIIDNGIWRVVGRAEFKKSGCQFPLCPERNKAAMVFGIKGYRNLKEAQADPEMYYEFNLCETCLGELS